MSSVKALIIDGLATRRQLNPPTFQLADWEARLMDDVLNSTGDMHVAVTNALRHHMRSL